MLGRDVLVLHRFGLRLRGYEKLAQARAEILLTALHTGKARDRRLYVVEDNLHVSAELAEHGTHNPFGLLKHDQQQMLRLNLLVLITLGHLYGRLNGLLAT